MADNKVIGRVLATEKCPTTIDNFTFWLLTVRDPANFNYVILNVYNLYRIIQISVSWTIKYYKGKKESGGATVHVNVCK